MLQARVVNLNEIVRDLESMLGRLIGERIALTTSLDPDLRNLSVDPGQIQQGEEPRRQRPRRHARGGRIVITTRNADRLPAAAASLVAATVRASSSRSATPDTA